mmetsp:Transcript_4280/g.9995  ORF Transcript_4280/g.9995 Transcript_4280/m.9995 type:complete len:133 (-) Transcript_4280:331-729(-)
MSLDEVLKSGLVQLRRIEDNYERTGRLFEDADFAPDASGRLPVAVRGCAQPNLGTMTGTSWDQTRTGSSSEGSHVRRTSSKGLWATAGSWELWLRWPSSKMAASCERCCPGSGAGAVLGSTSCASAWVAAGA